MFLLLLLYYLLSCFLYSNPDLHLSHTHCFCSLLCGKISGALLDTLWFCRYISHYYALHFCILQVWFCCNVSFMFIHGLLFSSFLFPQFTHVGILLSLGSSTASDLVGKVQHLLLYSASCLFNVNTIIKSFINNNT